MFCYRDNQLTTRFNQQNEKSTSNYECVSLPKPQSQLAQFHDDDEDVFATSLIDRYAARPVSLQNMCLATFGVTYDVIQTKQRKKKLMVSMTKKKKCRTQKMLSL